jgi:hypothetical protein
LRFLETAHHKLRAGAPLVPKRSTPLLDGVLRDLSPGHHASAGAHPDTLRYLVQTSGFTSVDVQYREPVREADRLERIPRLEDASPVAQHGELATLVAAVNAHADKLNARLFSSMDYAVIARR